MAVIGEHGVVVSEVRVEASPDVVFQYFTEPEKMARWMGAAAESDGSPGSGWRVDVSGRGWAIAGEIVEIDPPHRLVLTWGWEQPNAPIPLEPGASTVEVTFTPENSGTRVRVEHRHLPPELRAFHDLGWTTVLPRMAAAAAGGDPGANPFAGLRGPFDLDDLEG